MTEPTDRETKPDVVGTTSPTKPSGVSNTSATMYILAFLFLGAVLVYALGYGR